MRNLGLDVLRTLAVVLVLGAHLELPDQANGFLRAWKHGGWVGVDLFFVLSGFLVSGLLFREHRQTGSLRVTRFLIRRGFKIYPAFWVMLAVTIGLKLAGGKPIPGQALVGELLFLQNYLGGLWNHTWSLAVEEHFYFGIGIFFGVRAFLRRGDPFTIVPRLFLVVACACQALRVANFWLFPEYSHGPWLFATHIRIDSLLFGVLLSYLHAYGNLEGRLRAVPGWVLVTSGCVLLAPAFVFPLETHKWVPVFGVTLFYLGSGCLLLAALRIRTSRNPVLVLGGVLGGASYSMYLWHMPVNTWGTRLVAEGLGWTGFGPYLVTYLLGALGFGFLMSKLVEWPALRWRDRWFPPGTSFRGATREGDGRPALRGAPGVTTSSRGDSR